MSLRTVFERWSKAAERSSASLASCERALRLYEAHTNNIPIAKNTGPRLMTWSGNNNADVVLAANGFQVRFTTDAYLYYGGTRYTNVVVVNGQVLQNGTPLAKIVLVPASGGTGQVAVMQCINSTQLVSISGNSLSCQGSGSSGGTGTGSGGSGGATGGGSAGGGTPNIPAAIQCAARQGSGTDGLMFYNPSGYMRYQLSTTSAGSTSLNSLSWGVQYQNVRNLSAGSYSGSLRARLWAVSSSYAWGPISGNVLGMFNPNFTGSGARSSSQVYVGGYSTSQVQGSGSVQNPPYGSYCIVATLEEYNSGQYLIVDWVQFSGSAAFY